jgi:hypothetical protein
MNTHKAGFVVALIALAVAGYTFQQKPAEAQVTAENGHFQMLVTETGKGGGITDVMILDTQNGNLWRYWEAPATSGVKNSGGEGIKYITQLKPSGQSGQVIWQEAW